MAEQLTSGRIEQERLALRRKVNDLMQEVEALKETTAAKIQKPNLTSTSSSAFETDAEPPNKNLQMRTAQHYSAISTRALKDKILQLEHRLFEMTLENISLSLKLQDRIVEGELAQRAILVSLHDQYEAQRRQLESAQKQLSRGRSSANSIQKVRSENLLAAVQLNGWQTESDGTVYLESSSSAINTITEMATDDRLSVLDAGDMLESGEGGGILESIDSRAMPDSIDDSATLESIDAGTMLESIDGSAVFESIDAGPLSVRTKTQTLISAAGVGEEDETTPDNEVSISITSNIVAEN